MWIRQKSKIFVLLLRSCFRCIHCTSSLPECSAGLQVHSLHLISTGMLYRTSGDFMSPHLPEMLHRTSGDFMSPHLSEMLHRTSGDFMSPHLSGILRQTSGDFMSPHLSGILRQTSGDFMSPHLYRNALSDFR